MSAKLYYTWPEFDSDSELIARAVETSGKKFEFIWSPPRGGRVLEARLSYRLNLKIKLTSPLEYDLNGRPMYDEPRGSDWDRLIQGSLVTKILVVDEIADSGATLQPFATHGFFIATIFHHQNCSFAPNICRRVKDCRWVVFPWALEDDLPAGSKKMYVF